MAEIWWVSLPERNGVACDEVYNAMLDVAAEAGKSNCHRLSIGYARTDLARNTICKMFIEVSKRDDDLLVMLDADHKYPSDVIARFIAHEAQKGIVGALVFRRGEPYDPLFFMRDKPGGALYAPAKFDIGPVYQCAIVSTSAISIRRWVFIELERRGYNFPWFRYEYPTSQALPSEDMYFGRICEQAGLWHYCDTSLVIPHLTHAWVDAKVQQAWIDQHPDLIGQSMTVGAS